MELLIIKAMKYDLGKNIKFSASKIIVLSINKIKSDLLIFMGIILFTITLSGCVYDIEGRTFLSSEAALKYQQKRIKSDISRIGSNEYSGGSLLIYYRYNIAQKYAQYTVPGVYGNFLLKKEQNLLEGVKIAFTKSMMFDSVTIKKAPHDTDWIYPKQFGYRYLLIIDGWIEANIYDLVLDKSKTIIISKKIDIMVEKVAYAISTFEKQKSSKKLIKTSQHQMTKEELTFDSYSKIGEISITGSGFKARAYLLKRIADICSSADVMLKAGQKPPPGYYRITSEKFKDGRMIIGFEAR